MKPIIRVESISKKYRLGARRAGQMTLREVINGAARSPFATLRRRREMAADDSTLWALRDVSFEVQQGEAVGVIGRNGAGKSTLLKILSRITRPTEGWVELYGRASSLLEVGTGFHPELSGRENIFLNGAILGMRRREITRRFDEIVAFSEIERFIDTPVKHYSSGMHMRLAFAVAAHLEPEILIVDEVLAVGDAQFQKKCLGKMGSVAKEGRTVLFVSHNMAAVTNLCRRGLVLEDGRVAYAGTQTEAVARYLTSCGPRGRSLRDRTDRAGSGAVRVVAVEVRDSAGRTLDVAASGHDVDICLRYEASPGFHSPKVIAGLCVKTQFDTPVFLQHNRLTRDEWGSLPPRGTFICRVPRLPLPPAVYNITYSLMHDGEYLDAMDDAYELTVTDGDFFGSGEVPPATHGCCLVDASWRLEEETSVDQVPRADVPEVGLLTGESRP
ncbi:MAG: lipopolysaccharide transport system ATP-binding protein [Acidobacteriota bacterium]|jgi:lipopolysaccharide transport system ATP-binding protein|nr:lipopolysaccharide transport system ATP-binding protein [Acidobacteriota bacterium]